MTTQNFSEQYTSDLAISENGLTSNDLIDLADKAYNSRKEFKASISREDFRGEALLFLCESNFSGFDAEQGNFKAYFYRSLVNRMIDEVCARYSVVKTSRVRDDDAGDQVAAKFNGSAMASSDLDEESWGHEVLGGGESLLEQLEGSQHLGLMGELAPTLYEAYFGVANHPYDLVDPQTGRALESKKHRLAIVRDEADRFFAAVGEELFGYDLELEEHEALVEEIVHQFSKWRGARGKYERGSKENKAVEQMGLFAA